MNDLPLHNGEIFLPHDSKYLSVFNFILPLSDLFSSYLGPIQDYCVLLAYYYGYLPLLKQPCRLWVHVYVKQGSSTDMQPE